MNRSLLFLVSILLFSCDSEFFLDQSGQEEFGFDEDGDPVIINPVDDPNRAFVHESSYCYGYSNPDPSYQKSDI